MTNGCFDTIVLGAGLGGLRRSLEQRRDAPGERVVVVDAAARPGGGVRTQRSNGYVCELGPFAFARDEVIPLLELLARPPALVECASDARTGQVFDGRMRRTTAVEPVPVSFRTGTEELVQACRRELAGELRLGRAATAIRAVDRGFEVDLDGEAPATLRAERVHVCLPPAAAGRLLAPFERALGAAADRVAGEPRAFAFLGLDADRARDLQGYGLVAADDLDAAAAEIIFCTNVFPHRALAGHALARVEIGDARVLAGDDDAVLAAAGAELDRWTGAAHRVRFTKLHRFTAAAADGALAECRVRLRGLAARLPGLAIG
jgi:protoporphyrinogen oxidase